MTALTSLVLRKNGHGRRSASLTLLLGANESDAPFDQERNGLCLPKTNPRTKNTTCKAALLSTRVGTNLRVRSQVATPVQAPLAEGSGLPICRNPQRWAVIIQMNHASPLHCRHDLVDCHTRRLSWVRNFRLCSLTLNLSSRWMHCLRGGRAAALIGVHRWGGHWFHRRWPWRTYAGWRKRRRLRQGLLFCCS